MSLISRIDYGIPFRGQARYIPRISYVDVLNGAVPAEALTGKTVFVGATAAGLGDFLTTPSRANRLPWRGGGACHRSTMGWFTSN